MKILYLHQYFCDLDSSGGTRSYEFARRLIANGHEVRVITSAAFLDGWRQERLIERTVIGGIPATVIDVPYSNSMGVAARLWAFGLFALLAGWEALREPADVIFASSTPLTIAIPALLAKVWRRAPLVFEVRDLWPDVPIALGALRNPLLRGGARGLEWAAYHGAARVVALSPGIAAGVRRRGVAAERVAMIPNGCDSELFAGAQPGAYGFAPGDEGPLIVYAGTFGAMNNLAYVVEIAAAMRRIAPAVRFLLVGKGGEWERVAALARARGVLDRNLRLRPALPKREIPALLAGATVALCVFLPLPQMRDNSANKFFDALAAGKPLAINYAGWQADLLRESGAGIVLPPDDPVAAAEALAALLHDPTRLRDAAAAARALSQGFSRDRLAGELELVLHEALKH